MLQDNKVHQDMLQDVEERIENGVYIIHAKRGVAKGKHEFAGLFQDISEELDSEMEEETDDEEPTTQSLQNEH